MRTLLRSLATCLTAVAVVGVPVAPAGAAGWTEGISSCRSTSALGVTYTNGVTTTLSPCESSNGYRYEARSITRPYGAVMDYRIRLNDGRWSAWYRTSVKTLTLPVDRTTEVRGWQA